MLKSDNKDCLRDFFLNIFIGIMCIIALFSAINTHYSLKINCDNSIEKFKQDNPNVMITTNSILTKECLNLELYQKELTKLFFKTE